MGDIVTAAHRNSGKPRTWLVALAVAPALGGCTTSDLHLLGTALSLAADIHYLTSDDVCPRGMSKYYDAHADSVRCGYQIDRNDHRRGRHHDRHDHDDATAG